MTIFILFPFEKPSTARAGYAPALSRGTGLTYLCKTTLSRVRDTGGVNSAMHTNSIAPLMSICGTATTIVTPPNSKLGITSINIPTTNAVFKRLPTAAATATAATRADFFCGLKRKVASLYIPKQPTAAKTRGNIAIYGAWINAAATSEPGMTKLYAMLIAPNASPTNAAIPIERVVAATVTGKKNTYGRSPVIAHNAVSVAASVIERVDIFMSAPFDGPSVNE